MKNLDILDLLDYFGEWEEDQYNLSCQYHAYNNAVRLHFTEHTPTRIFMLSLRDIAMFKLNKLGLLLSDDGKEEDDEDYILYVLFSKALDDYFIRSGREEKLNFLEFIIGEIERIYVSLDPNSYIYESILEDLEFYKREMNDILQDTEDIKERY